MSPSSVSPATDDGAVLLRARLVLPMSREPIEDGAVLVASQRIVEVGSWRSLQKRGGARIRDLGEVLLLPGWINAHCHLDYTGMAGFISPPRSFSDWIKALLAYKAHWVYSDYAASWILGTKMLLSHGVTTVADIEAVPELLPDACLATPLRVCSLFEMTGVRSQRQPTAILQDAIARIEGLPAKANWAGLSPHAPYSTTPELLRLSAAAARQRGWLAATHVAESAEEFDMFMQRGGPMFDWLKTQRDMSDCGQNSPVSCLERTGLLAENFLAVHANYLAEGDASLLARRGVSVVHCPRSHDYFQHQQFPFDELHKASVNICVGTDSLASTRSVPGEKLELSLFAELQAMWRAHPTLTPEALIRMVTTQPADALGMQGQLGQLVSGAFADLMVIADLASAANAYDTVVSQTKPVAGVMIGGDWIVAPPT